MGKDGKIKWTEVENLLANRAEQAVLQRLPVDQKTASRVMKLLEPRTLKRVVLGFIGISALAGLVGSVGRIEITRKAVAKELKRQLEPMKQQLNELQRQNEELRRQNEELMACAKL